MNEPVILPNHLYKDRLFKLVFNDKTKLLKLYNALNGTHHEDPAQLTITTLENAIYMTMENDLSFITDMRLALYKQQSSITPEPAPVFFHVHNRHLLCLHKRYEPI